MDIFRIGVKAKTNADIWGDVEYITEWTVVRVPPVPSQPRYISQNYTFIMIEIGPITNPFGPVSGYFLVVTNAEDRIARRRRKRSVQDPTEAIPLSGTTIAFFPVDDLLDTQNFTLGDGRRYGGYRNAVLDPFTNYTIYFIVASSLDGETRYAVSEIADLVFTGPEQPTTIAPSTTTQDPGSKPARSGNGGGDGGDNSVIIAVIVVVVLLIVILVVVIVCYCLYKRGKRER